MDFQSELTVTRHYTPRQYGFTFTNGMQAAVVEVDPATGFVSLLTAGRVVVLQRQGLIERAAIATGGRPRLMVADPRGDALLVANEAGWVDLLR